jgi:hypothetical protein
MRGTIVLNTCRRAGKRPPRSHLRRAVSLTALLTTMLFAATSAPASADCTTGGSGCLPANGYSSHDIWNCGSIRAGSNCAYGGGSRIDWGWGSASDDGSPDAFVCVVGTGFFSGCSFDLARACFAASCDDQDSFLFTLYVNHTYGSGRTISGHGYW